MKSFIHLILWPATVGSFLIVAAAGCGRDSVKVYHVDANDTATPTPPPMAAPGAMPTSMPDGLPAPDNSGLPSLQYTLPAGWEKKAPTQMRVASFAAAQDGKQADVSVIPLAGAAGTDPANVNRWRGQVGLAALPETELAKLAEKVAVGDLPAELYDLAGTAPGSGDAERIIGVILHRDDTAWFFKMTGDAGVVEAQKPAFVAFLKSVSFGAPTAAPAAKDMSQLPASHPPIGGMNPGLPAATDAVGDKPTWTVPAGWQEGPLAQFLIAKYVITGANGASAAVNVSSLAGDGGGLLPNVNRWRTQLGLAPMAEADLANLPTIDASGTKATLIEFSGTDARSGKPAQLVGVVLPLNGQTWFYKLMGDVTVVAQQKDALVSFVQSPNIPMLINKIVRFFTSLKLTATLLAFSVVLVFIGTLAQADEGLYGAQAHYFKQWLVIGAHIFGYKIPIILPGGYLIGTLLLVNLVVAHIYRFEFTFKKLGIQLAHAGVILLLVGQLATDMLARELQMHFAEGEMRNYSDSATEFELIFQSGNEITAIPAKLLKSGRELKIENLPFTVLVQTNWHNSDLTFRAPMLQNAPPLTPNGIAKSFDFKKAEDVKTMDQRNIPTVILEFTTPSGSLGTWVASDWAGDASLVEAVRNSYAQMGTDMAQKIAGQLVTPQTIEVGGKKYTFTLRPARAYNPFSLTLLKATHTVYPGTDIPKDFRSRVLLDNPRNGEKREVEISMNHPLRYGGYTYYQYQMDAGQAAQMAGRTPTSVLQVVRNPSWLTPYIGCAMVGAGLVIQFMYHLVGFVSKRKTK